MAKRKRKKVAPVVAPKSPSSSSSSKKSKKSESSESSDSQGGVIEQKHEKATVAVDNKPYHCEICEYDYESKKITNAGSKEYPRWRCKQCHSGSRWTDSSLSSQGWQVAEMKRKSWSKYQRYVLRFRIWKPGDPEDLKQGCTAKKDRNKVMTEFVESLETDDFTEAANQIAWFTERQFIGYFVNWEMYTRSEAEGLWTKAIGASDYKYKTNKGGQQVASVALPEYLIRGKRVSKKKSKKKRTRKHNSSTSGDSSFDRGVQKRMRSDDNGANDEYMGVISDFLGRQPQEEFNSAVESQPLRKKHKAGSVLDQLQGGDLASQSDVVSKSTRSTKTSDGTGKSPGAERMTMTSARTLVKSQEKKLKSAYLTNKGSIKNQLEQVVSKLGANHMEVTSNKCPEKIAALEAAIAEVSAAAGSSDTWTSDAWTDKYKMFLAAQGKVEKAKNEIETTLASLRNVRKKDVQDTAFDSRKLSLKVRNLFRSRPLPDQGFPNTLVAWFGSECLSVTLDDDDIALKNSPDLENQPVAINWSVPMRWPNSCKDGVPEEVRVGLDDPCVNVAKTLEDCEVYFANEKNAKEAIAFARCPQPKANPKDVPWMPKQLMDKGVEFGRASGTPWIYGARQWGFRGEPRTIVCPSLGGFCVGKRGKTSVIMISIKAFGDAGSSPSKADEMFHKLTPSAAAAFMNKHAKRAVVDEGTVLWIPYGVLVWMIGCEVNSESYVCHFPVFCSELMGACSSKGAIRSFLNEFFEKAKENKPWSKMAPPIQVWLEQFKE